MEKQQHPQVSSKGKTTNLMKNAALKHSTKHEGKGKNEKIDLLPEKMKKS
ncbi:hypothetical protein BH11PAT1_BH11PAT1_5740 [soil metagenome]